MSVKSKTVLNTYMFECVHKFWIIDYKNLEQRNLQWYSHCKSFPFFWLKVNWWSVQYGKKKDFVSSKKEDFSYACVIFPIHLKTRRTNIWISITGLRAFKKKCMHTLHILYIWFSFHFWLGYFVRKLCLFLIEKRKCYDLHFFGKLNFYRFIFSFIKN